MSLEIKYHNLFLLPPSDPLWDSPLAEPNRKPGAKGAIGKGLEQEGGGRRVDPEGQTEGSSTRVSEHPVDNKLEDPIS